MTLDAGQLQQIYDPITYEQGPPFEVIDLLRQQQAVVWLDEQPTTGWPGGKGFWLVTRHSEVSAVLKNPKLFSSWLGGTQLRDPASKQDLHYVRQMMLNMDPPAHTRLRRLLVNAFTPRAVQKLEAQIREHAKNIIQNVIHNHPHGTCDFTLDIAADMPLLSLADILGMPGEDRYLMFDWANRVIGFQDPEYAASSKFEIEQGSDLAREAIKQRPEPDADGRMPDPRSRAGMPDLYHYAHLLAQSKREHPGDDIMSLLLRQVDDEGGSMSVEEFENMFWLFAVAGNETLRNGIPGGMIGLLQHPEAMAACQADPALIPSAVEEMLRWWTPVMIFRRTATEDTELDGQAIRKGDKVVVSFTSANRDEAVFKQPEVFNIQRDPNPHLAFGYGPHFCLGAQLARMQMRVLFEELFARLEHIQPAGEPRFLRSNFQRGVKNLPIRFRVK